MANWAFNLNADQRYRLIFHLVLWGMWIGVPIITAPDEHARQFSIAMIPVALSNIPIFLINSEWLIPKIFRKRGLPAYLLFLLALVVVSVLVQGAFKEWLVPQVRNHRSVFWATVPLLFVTAISTGYGFIVYLMAQEKARQEERQERLQSEVSFLRSQISPHFIFNLLNSIVYLIRIKSERAESVTFQLSELMRYMLYESGDAQVPLDQEIAYLENYVELQKIRFDEDVDIRLRVDGAPSGQVIEPMLLIPFVENAFKHGVGLVQDPFIDIVLRISERELDFSISNKIAPESAEDKDQASGIGLRNVTRRLELLYPDKHQLEIWQADGLFSIHLSLKLCGHRSPAAPTPAKTAQP